MKVVNMQVVLGVDPGKHTGLALVQEKGNVPHVLAAGEVLIPAVGEMSLRVLSGELMGLLYDAPRKGEVVIEDFYPYSPWGAGETLQIIGVVKYLAAEFGWPVTMVSPTAKHYWPEEKIRAKFPHLLGELPNDSPHVRDALGIALAVLYKGEWREAV